MRTILHIIIDQHRGESCQAVCGDVCRVPGEVDYYADVLEVLRERFGSSIIQHELFVQVQSTWVQDA